VLFTGTGIQPDGEDKVFGACFVSPESMPVSPKRGFLRSVVVGRFPGTGYNSPCATGNVEDSVVLGDGVFHAVLNGA
jgi:hypothetical protein